MASTNVYVVGVIPARLASKRLPNKPLLEIAGRPLIFHVWAQATRASLLNEVAVATPDTEIVAAVRAFGGRAVVTSEHHRSGTDRVNEAATLLAIADSDLVVNVQGDEPLLAPDDIDAVVRPLLDDAAVPMSSIMCPCPAGELDNPACVKVVCDLNNYALYFSRSRIPFPRAVSRGTVTMQHVGMYAYRRAFLRQFALWPAGALEQAESLEQLRALEHGVRIRMVEAQAPAIGVDTPEDLDRVRELIEGMALPADRSG